MITLFEHTIEETIINKNGFVLDLGCINFTFSTEMLKYCDNIICLDPSNNISDIPNKIIFERKAIVHNNIEEVDFYLFNDKYGNSLLNPKDDFCTLVDKMKVQTTNLTEIMNKFSIKQFELIKFDIEGSEYAILNNIDWTISKQYSIEFHDFRNMNPHYPNNEIFYEKLFDKMKNYCDVVKHEKTSHPGFPKGLGVNYWDSLFILKKKYWL